ncbi:MAG: metal ABC transporter permease [bacterium]|nr:metal ABC transporter permease [bacterium]
MSVPGRTKKVVSSSQTKADYLPAFLSFLFFLLSLPFLPAGYNSRMVFFGTALLGFSGGLLGTFILLRRRALMGDALAHSTLPGIAIAFLVSPLFGIEGKSLPLLLLGGGISGLFGVQVVRFLVRRTRLSEDAAIGAVLSVFFAAGVVLLGVIQIIGRGNEGGLNHFIYGQTVSLTSGDVASFVVLAVVFSIVVGLLFKEFGIVCFDDSYAESLGLPVQLIDYLLMALLVLVILLGLQAVGLLLVVAILVVPAAAARFWSVDLKVLTLTGASFGLLGAAIGVLLSAEYANLPAGSVIVLCLGVIFLLSFLLAPQRGLVAAMIFSTRNRLQVAEEHLLNLSPDKIDFFVIVRLGGRVLALLLLLRLLRQRIVYYHLGGFELTLRGLERARVIRRNHKLWHAYLRKFSHLPLSHVNYSTDLVEHVLSPEIVAALEAELHDAAGAHG